MDRAKQNNEAAVHSALLENLSDDAIASLASSVKYSEIRQNLYNSVDTVSTVQYTELVTEKLFITPFQLQLNLDIINLGTINYSRGICNSAMFLRQMGRDTVHTVCTVHTTGKERRPVRAPDGHSVIVCGLTTLH